MTTTEFELVRDDQGRLILKRPGQEDLADVRVRRAFPWSNPDRHVSVRNKEGKEVLLIGDLSGLSPQLRATIEQSLAESVFMPQITAVDDIDARFGYQQWKVVTDRGPREFRVQEREDIRFLDDGRFTVKDAEGNIYVLGPLTALDERSQQIVERLL